MKYSPAQRELNNVKVALIKKATEDREDKKKGIKVKGISMS
jgi:hypothetical protein